MPGQAREELRLNSLITNVSFWPVAAEQPRLYLRKISTECAHSSGRVKHNRLRFLAVAVSALNKKAATGIAGVNPGRAVERTILGSQDKGREIWVTVLLPPQAVAVP